MDLSAFVDRLNDTLDVADWDGVDHAVNGLQVGLDNHSIAHVAFAVDAAVATIDAANEAGADVLVVHHGISWGGIERVTGTDYDRLRGLLDSGLALYAVHLPLDAHPTYGNAALLADELGLSVVESFGRKGPGHVGQQARADDPLDPSTLTDRLSGLAGNADVRHLDFGPERVADIGIVTGSGSDWIREARKKELDALITGEGKQQAYHEARDAELHVYLAGHYATETFGVRALHDLVDDWELETTYLSHPTGL